MALVGPGRDCRRTPKSADAWRPVLWLRAV